MSEDLLQDIAEMNGQLDDLDDPRECYKMVQERIRRCEKQGETVPDDLHRLEKSILDECLAESQGR